MTLIKSVDRDQEIEIKENYDDGSRNEAYIGIPYFASYSDRTLTACVALDQIGTYEAILALAEAAGLTFEPTAARTGIILQKPEDKVQKRREELVKKFAGSDKARYDHLSDTATNAIEFIIDGEVKRGEL